MRRFPKGGLFAQHLTAGTLSPLNVDRLADLLADFHKAQAPAEAPFAIRHSPFASASAEARRPAARAALQGAQAVASSAEQKQLHDWLESEATGLQALRKQRRYESRVRECHGDLHLDNVVSLDGGVAAFDGIEFDPVLRWIDVLDDIAFPVMDFIARGRADFAL